MAKKVIKIIEYRFEGPWYEYARTSVPAMVRHYKNLASLEHPGAKVREREKV